MLDDLVGDLPGGYRGLAWLSAGLVLAGLVLLGIALFQRESGPSPALSFLGAGGLALAIGSLLGQAFLGQVPYLGQHWRPLDYLDISDMEAGTFDEARMPRGTSWHSVNIMLSFIGVLLIGILGASGALLTLFAIATCSEPLCTSLVWPIGALAALYVPLVAIVAPLVHLWCLFVTKGNHFYILIKTVDRLHVLITTSNERLEGVERQTRYIRRMMRQGRSDVDK